MQVGGVGGPSFGGVSPSIPPTTTEIEALDHCNGLNAQVKTLGELLSQHPPDRDQVNECLKMIKEHLDGLYALQNAQPPLNASQNNAINGLRDFVDRSHVFDKIERSTPANLAEITGKLKTLHDLLPHNP